MGRIPKFLKRDTYLFSNRNLYPEVVLEPLSLFGTIGLAVSFWAMIDPNLQVQNLRGRETELLVCCGVLLIVGSNFLNLKKNSIEMLNKMEEISNEQKVNMQEFKEQLQGTNKNIENLRLIVFVGFAALVATSPTLITIIGGLIKTLPK